MKALTETEKTELERKLKSRISELEGNSGELLQRDERIRQLRGQDDVRSRDFDSKAFRQLRETRPERDEITKALEQLEAGNPEPARKIREKLDQPRY